MGLLSTILRDAMLRIAPQDEALQDEALPFCGAILSNTLRPSTIGASAFRSGPRRAKKGENETHVSLRETSSFVPQGVSH
jgi:hypothetical protein